MKTPVGLTLSRDTLQSVDELVERGNFVGTTLRRRSRSDVIDVLLQFAIGRFAEWEKQRLNARLGGQK